MLTSLTSTYMNSNTPKVIASKSNMRVVRPDFTLNLFRRLHCGVTDSTTTPTYINIGHPILHWSFTLSYLSAENLESFSYMRININCAIKEYRLATREDRPNLVLEHEDAEHK